MTAIVPPSLILQASAMIERRIGIAVHTQFRGALDEILHTLSQGDIPAYLNKLEVSRETDPIWQSLVDALTIGETYFLRDEAHFKLLRGQLFPEIIAKHRKQQSLHITVWSVGCATGEEPYSLAITLYELLPDFDSWTIQLVGTDLNGKALHTARRGVYRKWAFRHTDLDFQGRYFDPAPDGLQIKPIIRQMVTFHHANLFAPAILPQFDLILCRNVLLYFSDAHTQKAETQLYNALAPGGWLLLGQAEALHGSSGKWLVNRHPGTPLYQKPFSASTPTMPLPKKTDKKRTTAEFNAHLLNIYHQASKALQEEEYEKASTLLHDLLENDPKHAHGHVLLASIEANRQQVLAAHNRLDIALEINPLLVDGYYLRAMLYMEDNEAAAAQKALHAALYCQRNHPLALFMLGNIYAQIGQFTRAARYWETALHAISGLKSDTPICNISSMTAGQMSAMINKHLNGWKE